MKNPLFRPKNHKFLSQNLKINKIKNKMKINKTIKERRRKTKRKTRTRTKIKEVHENKIFSVFIHIF
jgi:hypothetical protein